MIKWCFESLTTENYSEKTPVSVIAGRKIYRCSYNNLNKSRKKTLDLTRMYFVKSDEEAHEGAYLLFHFDQDKADLVLVEFIRKPGVDIEALKYVILQFLTELGYNANYYHLSRNGNSFFKKTL